jgi:hypothetical protein
MIVLNDIIYINQSFENTESQSSARFFSSINYIWSAVGKEAKFGLVEIGTYLGFLGLFALVVTNPLAKANLVPKHHPYLEESVYHQF